MGVCRKVVIAFLFLFISLFKEFSTAENPIPKGQHEIIIKPLSGTSNGDTYAKGVILPKSTLKVLLDLKNVQNASFVIFQLHSYVQSLVLSSDLSSEAHNSVNGTDIGLYTKLISMTANGTMQYFISNPNNMTVDFMVVPIFYSSKDPVPGGCNLSFSVDIAPFMSLTINHTNDVDIVQVDAQAAAQTEGDCEPSVLSYEVYEYFTEDTSAAAYFDAIRSIITPEKAAQLGLKSPKPFRQPELRRRFAVYPTFGSIYVVTVRNLKTGRSSAYVPISNFNCIHGNEESCVFYGVTITIVCLSVIAVVVFTFAECLSMTGSSVPYFMRLSFVVFSVVVLSPLVPSYLGSYMIFTLSIGLPIVAKQPNENTFVSKLIRLYRFITDSLYALAPAHIFYSLTIPVILPWVSTLENRFAIILIFVVFYLFFFCAYNLITDHGLDQLCGIFYAALLVSYATNGAVAQLFTDPSRILQSEMSDVMFYPPGSLIDKILLSLWILIALTCIPVRKCVRAALSSGEYQLVTNGSPQASRRYGSV